MSNEAIIQIGTIIIALIGAIITYIVVPYIRSKTTGEQFRNIEYWVKVAVSAAEQIFNQPGQGEKKKEYVLNFLQDLGIKITIEQLEILIEAAVHEINKNKLLPITVNGYLDETETSE